MTHQTVHCTSSDGLLISTIAPHLSPQYANSARHASDSWHAETRSRAGFTQCYWAPASTTCTNINHHLQQWFTLIGHSVAYQPTCMSLQSNNIEVSLSGRMGWIARASDDSPSCQNRVDVFAPGLIWWHSGQELLMFNDQVSGVCHRLWQPNDTIYAIAIDWKIWEDTIGGRDVW